jgi:single-stranded DNA-binding protein
LATVTGTFRVAVAPVRKVLPSGNPVTEVVLVEDNYSRDKDGNVSSNPLWLRASTYDKELSAKMLTISKSETVGVTGKLIMRSWETDKKEKRYSFNLRLSHIEKVIG